MSTNVDINLRATYRGQDDMRSLQRQVQETYEQWRRLRQENIETRQAYKQWRAEVGENTQELRQLSAQIHILDTYEREALQNLNKLENEHRELTHAVLAENNALEDYQRNMQRSEQHTQDAARNMRELREQADHAGDEIHDLDNTTDKAGRQMLRFGDDTGRTKLQLRNLADEVTTTDRLLKAGLITSLAARLPDVAMDAFQRVSEYIGDSTEAFANFDLKIREINTLLTQDERASAWGQNFRYELLEINQELGRTTKETIPALYQALSAGLDPEETFAALEEADKLARVTATNLDTTLLTIQKINAAYDGVYNTVQIADLLFTTVAEGIVTMPELTSKINEIVSVAAEAKVPLEDIVGAIITMTRQGDDMEELAGLLSNVLTQLQIPTTALGEAFVEAADVGFRTFIEEGGTLAEALGILEQHIQDTGSTFAESLGGKSNFYRDQQALRGALELTGSHLDNFVANTQTAQAAAGRLDEVAGEMAGSIAIMRAQTEASAEATEILVGEALEPFDRWWQKTKLSWAEFIGGMFEGTAASQAVNDLEESLKGIIDLDKELEPALESLFKLLYPDSRGTYAETFGKSQDQATETFARYATQMAGLEYNSRNAAAAIAAVVDAIESGNFDPNDPRSLIGIIRAFAGEGYSEGITGLKPAWVELAETIRANPDVITTFTAAPREQTMWAYAANDLERVSQWAGQIFEYGREQSLPDAIFGIDSPQAYQDSLSNMELMGYTLERASYQGENFVSVLGKYYDVIKLGETFTGDIALRQMEALSLTDEGTVNLANSTWNLNDAIMTAMTTYGASPEQFYNAALAIGEVEESVLRTAIAHDLLQAGVDALIPLLLNGTIGWDDMMSALDEYETAIMEGDFTAKIEVDTLDGMTAIVDMENALLNIPKTTTVTIQGTWSLPPMPDKYHGGASHQGSWSDAYAWNYLAPGERVVSAQEVARAGGPNMLDSMLGGAGGGANGTINIYGAVSPSTIRNATRQNRWGH